MSDPNQPDAQMSFSLGGLGAGEYDTDLHQPAPNDADERLELPRGALIAFRRSGGLRFTTREITVYRDGRVIREGGAARPAHLRDDQLAQLAHMALRARLARHGAAGTRQTPDGYAYEVAARIGRRVRRAEVQDGAIPAELAPLIRALVRLLGRSSMIG
ncbi:hypothetical protein K2Z83_12440 [Oscillochloris sp. ZM17-4]|uniref:protealysin inhibitor emfourin n=1 Tax=Oscillochloris sp. ZM17-4 TaxID=2866714 RepID=UPI001C72FC6E|nr:protealysin inhibitor emfourin [Oscillochloris sp. ZM17-4]MBX0328486.1 hypothetical protein [Oscillochloris sp. ZM17-4]